MIEWIVWRVLARVKKKLRMRETFNKEHSPFGGLTPLFTAFRSEKILAVEGRDFPGLRCFYQWILIPNSIDRADPPPPSWPNVVDAGKSEVSLGLPDLKWWEVSDQPEELRAYPLLIE